MKKSIIYIFILIFLPLLGCIQFVLGQNELVKTVYFKSDGYTISEKYKPVLDKIAKRLNSDTSFFIKVFGYADTFGTEAYNDSLSEKRAKTVLSYLQAQTKIDTKKIYIMWLGESDDVYDLHFKQANFQEKCVDVWIIFYPKKKFATALRSQKLHRSM